jgi:Gluconate 2-dehydrogenase subunit 3
MNAPDGARRRFLLGSGGALTGAWLASNWPAVAAAHEHAVRVAQGAGSEAAGVLSAAEAADVDAITAQILPSGASPGAREAHAVHFIDHALATFFADRAAAFGSGLAQFQLAFRAAHPAAASFAAASHSEQTAFLHTADTTPFFTLVRFLTVVGTLASSQYGGNFGGAGWKMLAFQDQHVFTAPFGYYDRDYAGFVPYHVERTP